MMIEPRAKNIYWAKWLVLAVCSMGIAFSGSHTLAQVSPLPDLVPIRLEMVPENAGPGDVPALRATIANQGGSEAGSFWVNIRTNNQVIASQLIPALGVSEQTRIDTLFVIAANTSFIEIVVDSTSQVAESDESNNTLRRQIDFAPDIEVTTIEFDPPFPKPAERTVIRATVTNNSSRAISKSFFVRFLQGRSLIDEELVPGIGANETRIVEGSWLASGGEQVVRVIADFYKSIAESDEANNLFTRIIDVTAVEPTGADLKIDRFEMTPANPQPGSLASLKATITNQGQGAASAFDVLFQADGFEVETQTVQGLGPGETATVSVLWLAEAAQRLMRVKADSKGVIAELDEINNTSVFEVDFSKHLDSCGQFVWLNVQEDAIPFFITLTGMTEEGVRDVFLPQIKNVVEQQYQGVNVQIRLKVPSGLRATITFTDDDRGGILGQAPLGARTGVGFVYMGSFTASSSGLTSLSLATLRVIIATVASHELGHLFGLDHTGQNTSDIMSANADFSPSGGASIPKFAPASLQQLERLLPFCS